MPLTNYTNLITVEHKDAPRFVATVELSCNAHAQGQDILLALPSYFDVDSAVGVQLDAVGEWVGKSRYVDIDLLGVYFEFDNEEYAVGWDEGLWQQAHDIETQTTALDDFTYRKVLYAKIAANHWNGTADNLYSIFEETFGGYYHFCIFDNLNMTFSMVIAGAKITQLDEAILKSGDLTMSPIGVGLTDIFVPPSGGLVMAWDVDESDALGGWDVANWPRNILESEAILTNDEAVLAVA